MRRLATSLLLIAAALIVIPAGASADPPTCQGVAATIVGTDGHDTIFGTSGNDVIVGLAGDDEISASHGDDLICGGAGDDKLYAGYGADTVKGGSGSDVIYGDNGDDIMSGGSGRDEVFGGDGNDEVAGNGSADLLSGGPGDDTVRGGSGKDLIGIGPDNYLSSGNDLIYGGSGADTIWAGGDDATVFGGRGRDRIFGEAGDDDLNGGRHADLLVGGADTDTAVGGGGVDDCSAETIDCENSIPWVGIDQFSHDEGLVTLAGQVHHSEPLKKVQYALLREESNLWVQPDGSFAADKAWLPATLDPLTQWDTQLSASIQVRRGHYELSVRAKDVDGDRDYLRPKPTLSVRIFGMEIGLILGGGNLISFHDMEPLPNGSLLGRGDRDGRGNPIPADGTGQTVRVSGATHDVPSSDTSIDFVEVAVQDTTTGRWLQTDGGFGAAKVRHPADCPQCDEGSSQPFLFDAELTDGDYHLVAYGLSYSKGDVAEMEWDFTVDGSVAEIPTVTVDQPMGTAFAPGNIAFSGTASDNFGVNRIRVSIRDRATGLWLQSIFSGPIWDEYKRAFPAELLSQDEPSTGWNFDALINQSLVLPPGSYNLSVAVHDGAMHRGSISPWLAFEVVDP